MIEYINLLRPKHWIKNGFIFLPLFFSGELFSLSFTSYVQLLISFIAFCFASSFIYILNDIKDVASDRLHPKKKYRPIASGKVTIVNAYALMVVTFVLVLFCLYFLNFLVALFIGLYVIINVLYCFILKNISIIDIAIISLGFVIRVLVGGYAVDIIVTEWLIIMVFLLIFSLSLAKRRDDLILNNDTNYVYRESQKGYTVKFIDVAKSMSFSVTLVAYIIFSLFDEVEDGFGSQYVYLTSFPVFIGIVRYLQITIIYENSGSPIEILFKDIFMILTILTWLIIYIILLYII
jgi:decaprenyl-phosphate phosphoribosyltransferase